jgi:hypothetical protein
MKKKLPGKMAGLKPGGGGKSKKMVPPPLKQKGGVKKEDGGMPFKKGGKVNCYAEGGAVSDSSGKKVTGVARGMGAAKRGGNFEY